MHPRRAKMLTPAVPLACRWPPAEPQQGGGTGQTQYLRPTEATGWVGLYTRTRPPYPDAPCLLACRRPATQWIAAALS
jgi:hypothetical protein